jgi:hypothetical protein
LAIIPAVSAAQLAAELTLKLLLALLGVGADKRALDVDLGRELDGRGVVERPGLDEADAGGGPGVRPERRRAVAAEVARDGLACGVSVGGSELCLLVRTRVGARVGVRLGRALGDLDLVGGALEVERPGVSSA